MIEPDILEVRGKLAETEALLERSQENLVGIFQKVGRGKNCPRCNAPVYVMPHLSLPRRDDKVEMGMYDPNGDNHRTTCVRTRLLRSLGAAR